MSTAQPAAPEASLPASPGTLLEYTLKTAPTTVVLSTATFTALGALTGSTIGVLRDIPAIPAAFRTSLNTGLFSFTFFSIREYLLHPLLTTLSLHPSPLTPHSLAHPSSPRTHNLLSTSLAGLSSGALFSYFTRGPKGVFRAGLTLGIGCTVLQSIVNEGGLLRIRTIHWAEERDRVLAELDAGKKGVKGETPPTYTRDIADPRPNVPSRETFSERSDRLIGGGVGWLRDGLARISPVSKMEEGDYERTLGEKEARIGREREEIGREMRELEELAKTK